MNGSRAEHAQTTKTTMKTSTPTEEAQTSELDTLLESLPPENEQPAWLREDPRAVRTVKVPDPGYDGVLYTLCGCGRWFHSTWWHHHTCSGRPNEAESRQ